jgi:putative restriction endonuclease
VGREAFLNKYGFGKAHEYFLLLEGKRYDSKVVAGVAFRMEHPDAGPLAVVVERLPKPPSSVRN